MSPTDSTPAVGAARKTVDVDLAAQSRSALRRLKSDYCRRSRDGSTLDRRARIAQLIHAVPITLTGVAPIARAISTAGGIAFSELDGTHDRGSRHVRRRGNAGLGSADRRLSAPGLVCDGRGGRARCAEVVVG